jgi:serine/threonine-protein kinase RsbT
VGEPLRFPVGQPVDVEITRRSAKELALDGQFSTDQIDDIVVAVSELATNLLRYAVDGSITLSVVEERGRRGFRMESRDAGPGIVALDLALQDGYSTAGSYGSGLPIVHRLMDVAQLESSPAGTLIVAYKWENA